MIPSVQLVVYHITVSFRSAFPRFSFIINLYTSLLLFGISYNRLLGVGPITKSSVASESGRKPYPDGTAPGPDDASATERDPTRFNASLRVCDSAHVGLEDMAQVPIASSNASGKRKLDDFSSGNTSPLPKMSNQSSLSSNVPERMSDTEAITSHFQLMYEEELELSEGSRTCLLDSEYPALQRLINCCVFSSSFHDCKPPSQDSPVWTRFMAFADEFADFSISPRSFINDLPSHIQNEIVEVYSEDAVEQKEKSGLHENYYTRVLNENPGEYAKRLERYGMLYPDDLPFVMIQLQYLGFTERAQSLLSQVTQGLGFPDVRIKLNSFIDGIHPSLTASYSGATIKMPNDRHADDKNASGNTSRMKNFMKVNADAKWLILRWVPLEQPLSRRLEWRTKEHVGQIEAVLTDCTPPNYNRARGGWLHPIELHDTVSKPLLAMLAMLPPPRPSDKVPAELTADLAGMVDEEFVLMTELEESEGLGGIYGEPIVQYLKREFVGRIRYINGSVTCVHLVKDVPKEIGEGSVSSSWTSDEAGRSVAQYQRIMTAIDDLQKNQNNYESIRSLDGPVVDFWRFPKLHKWWGLLSLLTGLYLRRALPYSIHSWSSEMSQLLQSTILVTLPLDLAHSGADPSLRGREAMAAVDREIMNHPHIQQTMNAPVDRNLRERVGTVHKVMIGPGELDFANNLVKGHLGSTFYRPVYFRHDTRRFTLVHGLSVALNRLTDDFVALRKTPTKQAEKIKLLDEIATEFERVAIDSGVRGALDTELRRQRVCDQAQGALLGKSVEVGVESDGVLVERPRKRRKIESKYPRNNGLLARGDARSAPRRLQLKELQDVDSLAQKLGLNPPLVGPDHQRPNTQEYSHWFLNLPANLSITQSLNAHGRTPAGIEGHKENGRRLGGLRKEWALASRERKTELMGGWTRAEQFEEMTIVIPTLLVDMTGQTFPESPRAAKCPKCLARVFGKDRHGSHRCTEKTPAVEIVKQIFTSYVRLMYPQDVFTLPDVPLDVRKLVAAQCNLVPSPAVDWALDDRENVLPTFPFPIEDDLFDSIAGCVYWDTTKEKDSPQNRLMAADVILRCVCAGDDPLHMLSRAGMKVAAGAQGLYNVNQDKVWRHEFVDRLVEKVRKSGGKLDGCICVKCGDITLEHGKSRNDMMRHSPCKQSSYSLKEEEFYWFYPRRLTDLPHSLARIILYRAVRGEFGEGQVKATGNGEGKKLNKSLSVLLEWSG